MDEAIWGNPQPINDKVVEAAGGEFAACPLVNSFPAEAVLRVATMPLAPLDQTMVTAPNASG